MKCLKCGTENNPGTKFCRGCGAKCEASPPEPAIPDGMAACPKCGHANQLGKKFCQKCGSPLAISATPLVASVIEPSYTPPPPPVQAMPEPAPMPYAPADTTGVYQPAANPSKSKMIVGVVAAVIALSGIGGGGYWYYQKVETEKAIALQRQQVEEQRLKAEAQAKADEAQRLAVQNARLEAEKRASEERQRLQAQMQQQQREADQRQQQMQTQLQAQQKQVEQDRQRQQATIQNQPRLLPATSGPVGCWQSTERYVIALDGSRQSTPAACRRSYYSSYYISNCGESSFMRVNINPVGNGYFDLQRPGLNSMGQDLYETGGQTLRTSRKQNNGTVVTNFRSVASNICTGMPLN